MNSTNTISISDDDIEMLPIRAQGSGGQNVNKLSSAIHLRFDIPASSLPNAVKERLLSLKDRRINNKGILVIKAQAFRTQEQNRIDARARLNELVNQAAIVPKVRKSTRPTLGSKKRRLEEKSRRSTVKSLRKKVFE